MTDRKMLYWHYLEIGKKWSVCLDNCDPEDSFGQFQPHSKMTIWLEPRESNPWWTLEETPSEKLEYNTTDEERVSWEKCYEATK